MGFPDLKILGLGFVGARDTSRQSPKMAYGLARTQKSLDKVSQKRQPGFYLDAVRTLCYPPAAA